MIPNGSSPRLPCFEALAKVALEVPMRYFGTELAIDAKADASPVTEADKATELALREIIMQHHPDDGIIGEEFSPHQGEAEYQWILDPIDGTKSFITGMPLFGVLIGLLHNGKPIMGAMIMPALSQVFFGACEKNFFGAWWNSKAIKTENITELSKAHFSLGEANQFCLKHPKAIKVLSPEFAMLRMYHDCYAFGLLAKGGLHGVIETGLQAYDILPLVPIIIGAGGVISNWQGGDLSVDLDGTVLATANDDLHKQALTLLQTI